MNNPGRRGYTLIELLVVLTVLGVLALSALPLGEMAVQRAREAELKQSLWQLRDAIDAYKKAVDQGVIKPAAPGSGYPPSLRVLVDGVATADASGTPVQRIYFLRRLPRDPFAPADLPPEKTWGLRSYQSPPDRPAPGEDVFDVYSLSDRTGLNGQPLKEW